jgi:phage replication O-like protein O
MNGHETSRCIESIESLGFKPSTKLNIFCQACSESIKVISDKIIKLEIAEFLNKHRAHDCFFGFSDGRKWKIPNNGGIESNGPQRIEPTIETTTPEEPLLKSNPALNTEKNEIPSSSIPSKQDVPIETPRTESIGLPERANPQLEDGFTEIANEIMEQLARHHMTGYQWQVLMTILRRTYGWHKKTDQISVTQFQKATGLDRRHVHRTVKELVEKNIVAKIGNSRIVTYGFQKDYLKWRNIAKIDNDAEISSISEPKKRHKKETIAKNGNETIAKNGAHKIKKEKIHVEGSTELRLAALLLEEIQKNKPNFKQPNLQTWAKEIDLMLRRDKRSVEAIERVIRWAQSDHGDGERWKGWAAVILSAGKLRGKFDELELRIQERPKQPVKGPKYIDGNIRQG